MKNICIFFSIFFIFSCSNWTQNDENINLKPVFKETETSNNKVFENSFVENTTITKPIIQKPINNNYYYEDDYIEDEYKYEDEYNIFWDYECTDDCSWHEAGYSWAEENSIDNEDDCWWNSNSFIEWCIQFVNDNY